MERDFMGLARAVKQEILEEPATDPPEVARSLAKQWSFSNKAHPQYLSFKATQDNNHTNNKPKIGFESLASAGLVTITTTTEVVDTIYRPYTSQIGAHHVPTHNGVVGTTELRGAPRTSSGPAQLTIFYAGSVSAYDNISPEKAQAIMLLAGNAPLVTPISTITSPVQTIRNSPSLDHAFVNVNNCHGISTSNFSSQIPITSRGTTFNNSNTNETTIIRSIGVLKSPSNTTAVSKIITSQQSHNLSAIPQARKASLVRFLERRKERVVSASPYDNGKHNSQHMTTTGISGNWTLSINSSGSSTPLPATN